MRVTDSEKQSELTSFEDAVKRLEEIVEQLDDQTLALDRAMALFEEGIKVSRTCAKHLGAARAKVEKLVEQTPGVFSLEAFDQISDDETSPANAGSSTDTSDND